VKHRPAAFLLALVRAYQRWVSPAFPRRCKYHPTCSAYAAEAIRELGPARGLILAAWRVLRCNPLSNGGIDEVASRRLFRGYRRRASARAAASRLRDERSRESPKAAV
jgi:putative membrane protein insertion efficiency factor